MQQPERDKWSYVSSYRLNENDVMEYLKGKFGNRKFSLEVGLTHSFPI